MKIGLAWLNQIRSEVAVGGFTAETFDSLLAQLEAAYHTEHTVDDHHATITATGSISERGRTTPLGEWLEGGYALTKFSAVTGSTWVVTSAMQTVYTYTLVGRTMTVAFELTGTSVRVAAATTLKIAIPANALPRRRVRGTFGFTDNGTAGIGLVTVDPTAGGWLALTKNMALSTFSVSAALSVAGQMAFEVN